MLLLRRHWFRLSHGLLGFGSRIVEGDFDPDLARIFPPATQGLPDISLPTSWDDNASQIDPRFADQICLLIVRKDGDLELVVIGGIVDGETKFLVPVRCQLEDGRGN